MAPTGPMMRPFVYIQESGARAYRRRYFSLADYGRRFHRKTGQEVDRDSASRSLPF